MPVHDCCLQCHFSDVDPLRAWRCMRSRTACAVESALCSFKGMVQLQYQVEPSHFAEGYAHEERQKAHKQWACLLEHGLLFVGPAPFGASDTFQRYGQAQCGGPQYGILAKKKIAGPSISSRRQAKGKKVGDEPKHVAPRCCCCTTMKRVCACPKDSSCPRAGVLLPVHAFPCCARSPAQAFSPPLPAVGSRGHVQLQLAVT